jgi:hypothetical protein
MSILEKPKQTRLAQGLVFLAVNCSTNLYCDSLELTKRNHRVESIRLQLAPILNNLGDPNVYPRGLASAN